MKDKGFEEIVALFQREQDEAKQAEMLQNVAKLLKGLYDSLMLVGFSEDQSFEIILTCIDASTGGINNGK